MARMRVVASLVAVFVTAMGTLGAAAPTAAAGTGAGVGAVSAPATAAQAPGCSVAEWQADFRACVGRLSDVGAVELGCMKAPVPGAPDSGLAGWFAAAPPSAGSGGPQGIYSQYGYAGYDYPAYDASCVPDVLNPQGAFESTVADAEFMIATAVIGASNALRERAWDPGSMWAWADPLVTHATRAIYEKVFSVFGVLTLCVVGLYLLWRSRQSDMSSAMTTAGWAVLVMVAVTALAAWPVASANLADAALTGTLGVVHDAVGPRPETATTCDSPKPDACDDKRPPAVRASDTATETMLYRNWLRGALGSADTTTARKYGRALYDAKSLTWTETQKMRTNPATRTSTIAAKQEQWNKVAAQIKTEDPEAYEYLTGVKGMERVGAGFIAVLAAILYAMFDLTASLLVLLGFLIFRWAVIAAPVLGTIGLLRPASAGIRRLANAVVAAVFNIAIFGTGAAIYLFAVDMIMGTATLPGWLQVVLVWLCGVVGWLLLRPYRRITQLGGKDSSAVVGAAGGWHRRFFRDVRDAAVLNAAVSVSHRDRDRVQLLSTDQTSLRPETRYEDTGVDAPAGPPAAPAQAPASRPETGPATQRRGPTRVAAEWSPPEPEETPTSYAVYRPDRADTTAPAPPRVRAEAS
ncbi:MFS transporter [Pilimelia columellifera]|uniref:MFS transporter n=1 Tax=Pilimelia columellifera subsp. columellifera TaxID=706583 RepID=A0ABN3NCI8_9ACTN